MNTVMLEQFITKVKLFYSEHQRVFPWRYVADPYYVVVSEIMLQQTQTARISEKYQAFIETFSSFNVLANAQDHALFFQWQGLGYNRRAVYLRQFAQWVVQEWNGILPNDPLLLVKQKGIGPATAASICAFAFNIPTIFIETNIRTVFLHEFFTGQYEVHDRQLIPYIQATIDTKDPRSWYYALMDYGVFLKKQMKLSNNRSAHYKKQSKFVGSDRQIRGMFIKLLVKNKIVQQNEFFNYVFDNTKHSSVVRIQKIIDKMIEERLIKRNINNNSYTFYDASF